MQIEMSAISHIQATPGLLIQCLQSYRSPCLKRVHDHTKCNRLCMLPVILIETSGLIGADDAEVLTEL